MKSGLSFTGNWIWDQQPSSVERVEGLTIDDPRKGPNFNTVYPGNLSPVTYEALFLYLSHEIGNNESCTTHCRASCEAQIKKHFANLQVLDQYCFSKEAAAMPFLK